MDVVDDRLVADLSIETAIGDGLSYSADNEATVYVKRCEIPPLRNKATHLEIKVKTPESIVYLRFDGRELDGLVDALNNAQTFYREADR